jgi:hypothetical protein
MKHTKYMTNRGFIWHTAPNTVTLLRDTTIRSLTVYTGWSKSLCAPDDYSTVFEQSPHHWRFEDGHHRIHSGCGVLYWTQSSRTQFGMSINVWRLAGDTLNITCNFLYCNHQMLRDFLITLYKDLYPLSH